MVYESGLPFSKIVAANLDKLIERVADKKAVFIINDGALGEGKTTIGVHEADYINGAYRYVAGKGFPYRTNEDRWELVPEKLIDLKKVVAMGGKDFIKKLGENYRSGSPVVIYDEGGDFAARGALTKANATLNRVFETYRAFKVIVIMTVPNFGTLDGHLFDKQIPRMLIHCHNRSKGYGNFKGFDLKGMLYLRDKMKKMIARPLAYNYVKPAFYGVFHDLDPERSRILDALGKKGKELSLEKANTESEGLLTYKDIADRTGKSIKYVKVLVHKIQEKPEKYIDRVAYYREDILLRLKFKRGAGELALLREQLGEVEE